MNEWKYKGSSSFYHEEAGKIFWGKSLEHRPNGKLALQAHKRSTGHPGKGAARAETQWCERMWRYQGTPRSPSVHVERRGLTWVKATSLQGLGGPAWDLGLHPEEKPSLKCTHRHSMARLAFQRENLAAVSTHPNVPFPDEETKDSSRATTCLRLSG